VVAVTVALWMCSPGIDLRSLVQSNVVIHVCFGRHKIELLIVLIRLDYAR